MAVDDKKREEEGEKLTPFEPGLPVSNVQNRRAAEERGLTYNPKTRRYHDSEGWPARDRYGQPLG